MWLTSWHKKEHPFSVVQPKVLNMKVELVRFQSCSRLTSGRITSTSCKLVHGVRQWCVCIGKQMAIWIFLWSANVRYVSLQVGEATWVVNSIATHCEAAWYCCWQVFSSSNTPGKRKSVRFCEKCQRSIEWCWTFSKVVMYVRCLLISVV